MHAIVRLLLAALNAGTSLSLQASFDPNLFAVIRWKSRPSENLGFSAQILQSGLATCDSRFLKICFHSLLVWISVEIAGQAGMKGSWNFRENILATCKGIGWDVAADSIFPLSATRSAVLS